MNPSRSTFVAAVLVVGLGGATAQPELGLEPSSETPRVDADRPAASEPRLELGSDAETRAGSPALAASPAAAIAPPPVQAAVGAGAAAAGGLMGWKLVTALFTRLRRDELLEEPERRRVYDVVTANPGVAAPEAAALTTRPPNTVRYHLRVLRRHGRIRAFWALRGWRYCTIETDPGPVRRRLLLDENPRLAAFVDTIPAEGAPATDLVARIQARLQLPRSSSWYLVKHAVASGLVASEKRAGRMWLRSA